MRFSSEDTLTVHHPNGTKPAVYAGGLLSVVGAGFSAKSALEEWRAGRRDKAAVSSMETVGLGVSGASSLAWAAGAVKAAPLAKAAGPVGTAVAFAAAGQSLLDSIEFRSRGNEEMAMAHMEAAAIKSFGAIGSIASSVAIGMSAGSFIPVVGNVVGAGLGLATGIAISYLADKQAEKVIANANNAGEKSEGILSGLSSKLSQRRLAREAEGSPISPQMSAPAFQ